PDLIVSKRAPLRAIASSTGFLGFIAGLLCFYTLGDLARSIHELIQWSSPLLSYTATFTMGLRIPTRINYTSEVREMLLLTSIYRYLLAPLLALAFVVVLDMSLVDKAEFVVISLMPPAVMNALVAEKYGWNSQLIALTIALLTVLFLVLIFPVLVLAVKVLIFT
ncbi:AEC family transporter, partial [Thermofilum sp.]|uniref:AEC family transporter n=1 Tax=Thermofilum sp. TaxID=1961369 RepID=UPI00315F0C17